MEENNYYTRCTLPAVVCHGICIDFFIVTPYEILIFKCIT